MNLHFVSSLSAHLGHMLAHYGGWGLFLINLLDSSVLAFPIINDLLLIHLASQHHRLALIYALEATAGSVLGAFLIYGLARGGRSIFGRKRTESNASGLHRWVMRNNFVSMLVASLLPPPAPFKVFPLAAGVLRLNAVRFLAALMLGRTARFVAEALIGVSYGVEAEAYFRSHLVSVSIITIAVIVGATVAYRWLVGRS